MIPYGRKENLSAGSGVPSRRDKHVAINDQSHAPGYRPRSRSRFSSMATLTMSMISASVLSAVSGGISHPARPAMRSAMTDARSSTAWTLTTYRLSGSSYRSMPDISDPLTLSKNTPCMAASSLTQNHLASIRQKSSPGRRKLHPVRYSTPPAGPPRFSGARPEGPGAGRPKPP